MISIVIRDPTAKILDLKRGISKRLEVSRTQPKYVRCEVLVTVKMSLFWVVTLCGLTGRYRRLAETYISPEDEESMSS
jgi:hypothetical protein